MKKYLFTLGVAALSFGAAKGQTVDSVANKSSSLHPDYPKTNVEYFSEEECYAQNPDTCVVCRQERTGTWWAVAKFPTLIDKDNKKAQNSYWSLFEAYAINGMGVNVKRDKEGFYYVVDPRMGRDSLMRKAALNNQYCR